MTEDIKSFYRCSKCGKKLIERKQNGIWRFLFGKNPDRSNIVPVCMEIYGSVKMKCIRRSCREKYPDHWNEFNFLPNGEDFKDK